MKDQALTNDQSPSKVAALATVAAAVTLVSLISLHFLSPEFDPSFRQVSEYALGHYGRVLTLMFLSWAISSWALAAAIRSQISTKGGRIGWWFLIIAGLGEALASVFDVTHEVGHGIAGLLGVLGFPVAAVLLSVALGRVETWQRARKPLLWLANLSWLGVLLLIATLILMTMQLAKANGGHLPQHAPKHLPPGVIGLAGWADRLIIVIPCLWVIVAGAQPLKKNVKTNLDRRKAES